MTLSRLPGLVLSACVLGLVTCPLVYVALGAPMELVYVNDRVIMLALCGFGCAFLFWRYLTTPTDRKTSRWLVFVEILAWMALAYFVATVSRFRLSSDRERAGMICLFFTGAAALWLPLVIFRRTALVQRLANIPASVLLATLLVLLAGSGAMIYQLFALPPDFI
jgi:hypothetical protein